MNLKIKPNKIPSEIDNSVTPALIEQAMYQIKDSVNRTLMQHMPGWSKQYDSNIYVKREDLQVVRSYKLRGALFKLLNLSDEDRARGVVCASAGNHAQGVAFAAHKLGIHAKIFMPETTPQQKIMRVKKFGKDQIEIILLGDSFDDAYETAIRCAESENKILIPPFNDEFIIAGQGTVGVEILEQLETPPDIIILPVGGGGLAAGVSTYVKSKYPHIEIIGVEPTGAAAMKKSIKKNEIVTLARINRFADGAAVMTVGVKNFEICKKNLSKVITVDEGKLCSTIIQLYTEDAIVAEPAGVLAISALDLLKDEIKGKTVVCILSGGNNDILRMEEIKERSLLYEGLKHYFLIRFPQRTGALKEFLQSLGPNDDITHFEYTKKNNRENGPAIVGIELKSQADYKALLQRMDEQKINYQWINDRPMLFEMLV